MAARDEAAAFSSSRSRLLPGAPVGMTSTIIVGVAISLAAVVAIPFTGPPAQLREALNKSADYACPAASTGHAPCRYQLQRRADRLRAIDKDVERSLNRRKALLDLMYPPQTSAAEKPCTATASIGARAELDLESKVADDLREDRNRLMVRFDLVETAGAFLVGTIVALGLTSLFLRSLQRLSQSETPHRSQANPAAVYRGWWRWCGGTVVLVVGTGLYGQYLTAVETDKSWFGFDSLVISAPAWIWVKIGILGNQILAGCAVAVFACVGHPRERPEVAILMPRAGIGSYVDFMRKWTALGFLTALVVGCYWLWIALADSHRSAAEKVAYGLPVVGAALPIGLLLWRVVRNMRALHEEYEKALAAHEDRKERRPAADPTQSFFEDKMWQLPSAIVALGSAAWFLLDILGVRKSLLGH